MLERDSELAAIVEAGARAAGGDGRAVVVEGPAGIGKTGLVRAARPLLDDVGLKPLEARGSELERALGFGVVRQSLAPRRSTRSCPACAG